MRAARPLIAARRPLPELATTVATYQRAAATSAGLTVSRWADAPQASNPEAFAGVSSMGYPVLEPLIATIDAAVSAPATAIPAPWWQNSTLFEHSLEMLIHSEVADAGRSASQVEMVAHEWTYYVRVLTPPSCARCAILAGRRYRWSTGFDRHPGCDCQMVPADDPSAAEELLTDPRAAAEAGQIGSYRTNKTGERIFTPGLSKSDLRAILDGADPTKVVNAYRGLSAPGITAAGRTELFGRTVKYTTEGTKRSAWRKANPSRMVRLRPESIYQAAKDQADAVRLLGLYGYL